MRASFLAAPVLSNELQQKYQRQKNKKQRGGFAFFGYFFGEAKK
jgi:hypothetical protein